VNRRRRGERAWSARLARWRDHPRPRGGARSSSSDGSLGEVAKGFAEGFGGTLLVAHAYRHREIEGRSAALDLQSSYCSS
jgi:hypothetical protein